MNKPRAVIISDIHFTVSTLNEASYALQNAITAAAERSVPLIIAGDTLDSKSIIRAEVANKLIEILSSSPVTPTILVGNHDMCNEQGTDHSLVFLRPYANIVDSVNCGDVDGIYFIPYCSKAETFYDALNNIPKGSTIICHQGLRGADMGHYITDKSGIDPSMVKNYRIISGHYHKRQDIVMNEELTNMVGLWSYVGNPYTLTFGEADDPSKGYQILNQDGTLEHVPLNNLRKHVVIKQEITPSAPLRRSGKYVRPEDLVWVKIEGPDSIIQNLTKQEIGRALGLTQDFKLDRNSTSIVTTELVDKIHELSPAELFDKLIDESFQVESDEFRSSLKKLWKEVINETKKL